MAVSCALAVLVGYKEKRLLQESGAAEVEWPPLDVFKLKREKAVADLIWCLLIALLWVWGWAGDFFYSWYFWDCVLHSSKPMGDADNPHDIFLTQPFNGVSWGVCVPEMWQGRHRSKLWWKMSDHFSQEPASCLLHSPCAGPVLQTRTLTRMVKCPLQAGDGQCGAPNLCKGEGKAERGLWEGDMGLPSLCSYGLAPCKWLSFGNLGLKMFACQSTQWDGPNRHVLCVRNGIRPCWWDPISISGL